MPADTLTVSFPGKLLDDVRAAAAARGLTPEEYIRQRIAIDIALDDDPQLLHAEGIEDDLAAIAEYERTGEGIPWEEVRDWMRSWGSGAELPRPTARKIG